MTPKKSKSKKAAEKADKSSAESSKDVAKETKSAAKERTALERLETERDDYKDRLQRATADFSNYQKRMQREMEELRKYAASPVALDLLGVVDNLHRALKACADQVDDDFLQGLTMIEAQLIATLEKHGVTQIEAMNKPFDPNLHDALLETEDQSLPDKTVVEELEKGYKIHDRLLRPTKVKVSRVPSDNSEQESQECDGDQEEDR